MSKRNLFSVDKSLEKPERVLLVGVMLTADYSGANETRERGFQTALTEAAELVGAAGGDLVSIETSRRDKPHPASFVGTGKAEELAAVVKQHDVGLVVFNHELTPTQERNLEKELQCRVLDRVGLILAIFAKRAQSQEGKLQVELAQLNHLSGRLERAGRNPAGNRPPFNRTKNHGIEKTACRCPQTTRHAPQIAHERPSENLCHCRLYQCRKIQPVQPLDQSRRIGERPVVRYFGYHCAPAFPVA